MMETLEQQQQQQTKNTPTNIEPHAGNAETTPTASEEDDFEEHNNACDLETKEKTKSPQWHPMLTNSTENSVQNGRSRKDSQEQEGDTSPIYFEAPVAEANNKEESVVNNDNSPLSTTEDVKLNNHNNQVDIKIKADSPTPSINIDEDDVKNVGVCSSKTMHKNDLPTCSSSIKENEENSAQEEQRLDKDLSSTSIKIEEKSPLASVQTDEEFTSLVPKIEEQTFLEETNSQDEATSKSVLKMVEENSMQFEEETSSSKKETIESIQDESLSTLKSSEEIKSEADDSLENEATNHEEASSPVKQIEEETASSTQETTEQVEELTTQTEEATAITSPVYKINDLSPASIPDDDASLDDFNVVTQNDEDSGLQPKVERDSPMETIKIESDSEDVALEIEDELDKATFEHSDKLLDIQVKPVETVLKMKINGAHALPEQMETETEAEAEPEATAEAVTEGETLQLSVITNNIRNEQEEHEQHEQPVSARRCSSSRSSSVSSTSQQLVIDHPESEQNAKLQLRQLSSEEQQQQQTLQATKRRRSSSNSDNQIDNNTKQQRLEEPASLLLQRLQAPTVNANEAGQLLSCFKCKASNFQDFQQLNAHHALCQQTTQVEAAEELTPVPDAVPALKKERFFRCARCSTVFQCWSFFLHMRDVHQRYICLYCSHVFASVEKLSLHLENKHDMDQRHFGNVEAWQTLQTQEDRARYLVCCNCQASFARGSHFDDHDCNELMQPCALCGLKGSHANDCRNGSTAASRKKAAVRRKRKTAKSKPNTSTQAEETSKVRHTGKNMQNWLEAEADVLQNMHYSATIPENIPAASPLHQEAEAALPKLVVPKIMLRVPKQFQKSVDAALSSTDTEAEEEEPEDLPTCSAAAAESSHLSLLTVDAVQQQQQQQQQQEQQQLVLTAASPSEDTETATETASTFLEATSLPANAALDLDEDDDSATAKLTRVLAEFERTMLDIQRTRAHMLAKKEQHQYQQEQQEQPEQQQQELQAEEQPTAAEQVQQPAAEQQQQRQWSPTPPASPNNNNLSEQTPVPKQPEQSEQQQQLQAQLEHTTEPAAAVPQRRDTLGSECMDIDESLNEEQQQPEQQLQQEAEVLAELPTISPPPPADGIEVANPDTHTVDLQLDRPLDKFEMVDFVRLCLKSVYPYCLYCNHARRIAVNAKQLVLHLIAQHRYTATVDSITAEELQAETIVNRLKSYLPALEGDHYMNSVSCCSLENGRFAEPFNERIYECFQCRYITATHKELYTHNRRLHIKTNITCTMCRLNFFSYSELLCHICPGVQSCNVFDVQFRCCLCDTAPLPSAFRLMVHLRKQHQACDICLEDCQTQAKLSAHVWKHKLLHLCYRCGIAYRNKQDISKHLFWKHGTESASCKRCLQKRWRHVYHFCVPAAQFTCEHCQFNFSKAIYLEVHKRQHVGDFRYACTEEQCEEKFVSRKLLLKHAALHEVKPLAAYEAQLAIEAAPLTEDQAKRYSRAGSVQSDCDKQPQTVEFKSETERLLSPKLELADEVPATGKEQSAQRDKTPPLAEQSEAPPLQTQRKRRKKNKRNKASLEDLNLIAPNLSESDSSEDSDSDAARSSAAASESKFIGTLPLRAAVDDLDMPRVMLSPASESDNEEQQATKQQLDTAIETKEAEQNEDLLKLKQESDSTAETETEQKPKLESAELDVADIWKNLLQHQPTLDKAEPTPSEIEPTEEQLRPQKLHVAYSDHDYCKLARTPPPTPKHSPKKPAHGTPNKSKRGHASSDSDSSSSSSSSGSDSSSCSCGSNCSCSSSGSSSSDDDSDNESHSSRVAKKVPKKSAEQTDNNNGDEYVNVTSNNEEEPARAITPTLEPKAPDYNESDFDTAVSDTDEEFYDAHPQKLASELLAQKRLALLSAQAQEQPSAVSDNYDIVENSRPSTPSLPEEAAAFADKRERIGKNKKKKRERKSTCKSTSQTKLLPALSAEQLLPQLQQQLLPQLQQQLLPQLPQQLQQQLLPQQLLPQPLLPQLLNVFDTPTNAAAAQATSTPQQQQQLQLFPESPMTPITHHHRPAWPMRVSEGSSCSDADGQLKRSKRTRRPNKFYGYTSDDENMSSVLAPPLQVGMQLIKPQPPPQLTWAKEDLPTPPKQQRSRSNHNDSTQHSQQHSHSHQHSNGSTRKRNKRTPLSGGSGSAKRSAKRVKPQQQQLQEQQQQQQQQQLPPIPTLKIRPALLPAAAPVSDSSDSSSDEDEQAEINVTSLPVNTAAATAPAILQSLTPPMPALPVAAAPPPPPATTAFNQPIPPALLPNPDFATLQYFKANNIRYPIRPPAGARLAREGESVYCYCRCPYDEVSEMIACDGDNCLIEWFHFECVGIMVAPQGKWFCAECRPKYSEGLYPGARAK